MDSVFMVGHVMYDAQDITFKFMRILLMTSVQLGGYAFDRKLLHPEWLKRFPKIEQALSGVILGVPDILKDINISSIYYDLSKRHNTFILHNFELVSIDNDVITEPMSAMLEEMGCFWVAPPTKMTKEDKRKWGQLLFDYEIFPAFEDQLR